MPRAKPKLPGSTVMSALEFQPSEEFDECLARHLGSFAPSHRVKILAIVDSFYVWEQFERNAVSLDQAEARLAEIRKAAEAFWQALLNRKQTGEGFEAEHAVEHEIDRVLELEPRCILLAPAEAVLGSPTTEGPPQSPPSSDEAQDSINRSWLEERLRKLSVSELIHMMTSFRIACDRAEEALSRHREGQFYRDGKSWEKMVSELVGVWMEMGLPPSAAKHHDPSASSSPFVAFIADLQTFFPAKWRKHVQSPGALAGKISKLLPEAKKIWRESKRQSSVD
jgi:hypothetical protein